MTSSCIYNGNVIHKRFKPKEHFFKYKVFSLFIDLSELKELDDKLKFFSINKENTLYLKKCSFGLNLLWITFPLYIQELVIKIF